MNTLIITQKSVNTIKKFLNFRAFCFWRILQLHISDYRISFITIKKIQRDISYSYIISTISIYGVASLTLQCSDYEVNFISGCCIRSFTFPFPVGTFLEYICYELILFFASVISDTESVVNYILFSGFLLPHFLIEVTN